MNYFLAKTEPNEYSIDDLAKAGEDIWDGVTNPVAVKNLRSMQIGDQVLIYHSVTLEEIKASHQFDDWALVRQGRLSTMPVPNTFITLLKQKSLL